MAIDDLRDLDRRAVRASVDVLTGAAGLDLTRPTPCAGWNLGELLAHMTVQHHG
ncbi:maleylpyruvate isomerase N-terminal domain-containing protein, partial [Micromonospora zhanjiangensis]